MLLSDELEARCVQGALLASLGEGPMIVGVYDAHDVLAYANRAFRDVFALPADGRPLTFADVVLSGVARGCGVRIERGDPMAFIADAQLRRREAPGQRMFATDLTDGRWFWMTETLLCDGWITVMGAEITALKRGEDELKRARDEALTQSRTDALTGLPNRRRTLELLDVALEAFVRPDAPVSIAIVDLDGFKQINDNFGHWVGDVVLESFATLARTRVRRQDTVGRIGGEEFLVVLPGATVSEAARVLDGLRGDIACAPVNARDVHTVCYTFSAGVAQAQVNEHADAIMRRADGALYRAKRHGRNRVEQAS
jgi:diguanylate cyclase